MVDFKKLQMKVAKAGKKFETKVEGTVSGLSKIAGKVLKPKKKIKSKKILKKQSFTVVLKQKPKKSIQPSSFFAQELNEDIDEMNLFLK